MARMANALNRELGIGGDPFTADRVLEHGFGTEPRFALLIADVDGKAAGYAMYHVAYDSDIAATAIRLVDLYVDSPLRRLGVGRELMRALARETVRSGAGDARVGRPRGKHESDRLLSRAGRDRRIRAHARGEGNRARGAGRRSVAGRSHVSLTIPDHRRRLARVIALAVDALQIAILPLLFPGSPWNNAIDLVTGGVMVWLLGWHIAFLPTFITELIPFVDLFPTWTLAVLYVTRKKKSPPTPDGSKGAIP